MLPGVWHVYAIDARVFDDASEVAAILIEDIDS